MKYDVTSHALGAHTLSVFCPRTEQPLPVLCLNAARSGDWDSYLPRLAAEMGKTLRPAMLACVEPTDWNRDFSPWPAPGLHPDAPPFAGQADARIALLCDAVLPFIISRFPTLPGRAHTGIFGYSLGGLAALYALYRRPDVFGMAGCLSGSLWYEGFMDFQRENISCLSDARVYLSLGRKEERTRHPRMGRIGASYEETHALLSAALGAGCVAFDLNPGGHGSDVDGRMLLGLRWLLSFT